MQLRRQTPFLALTATVISFAISSCPSQEPKLPPLDSGKEDEFSSFATKIAGEDGMRDALAELQSKWMDDADQSNILPSDAQSRNRLGHFVESGGLGLEIHDESSEVTWRLECWHSTNSTESTLRVQSADASPGGYQVEASDGENAELGIVIKARWVQGRCLQVSRELTIADTDLILAMPFESTAWTLSGPKQPFFLLPGEQGPYGELRGAAPKDAWLEQQFPRDLAIPAAAAYGDGGMLLCIVDDHQLRLSRRYVLGIQALAGTGDSSRLRCGMQQYDPTRDEYGPALLATGLTLRETIVICPLDSWSSDSFAETRQTIDTLAQVMHGFVWRPRVKATKDGQSAEAPNPTPDHRKTAVLNPADWDLWLADLPEGIEGLCGWGQIASITMRCDSEGLASLLNPTNAGQDEFPSQALKLSNLAGVPQPVCLQLNLLRTRKSPALVKAVGTSGFVNGTPSDAATGDLPEEMAWLAIRNPSLAAWSVRTTGEISEHYAACLDDWTGDGRPPAEPGRHVNSWDAHALAIELYGAASARKPALQMCGLPRTCRPPYADLAVLQGSNANGGDWSQRAKAMLCSSLFGIDTYAAAGEETLAGLVLNGGAGGQGVVLNESEMSSPGADGFIKSLDSFAGLVSQPRVLWSAEPEPSSSDADARQSLVYMLPHDPVGTSPVWIGFIGAGGGVAIDEFNIMTVKWGDGLAAIQLPPGYWVADHPSTNEVQPGDVVVVTKKFLTRPSPDGTTNSSG